MKEFVLEFIGDLRSTVIELGIFPTVFMCIIMIPVFIVSLIFLPFEIFNDWSKSWFKVK